MDILMPQMGVSVDAGTLLAWSVAVGDQVEAEQLVCEVATDKVDTEIVAPAAGEITELLVGEGEEVPVGEPVARMSPADGSEPPVSASGSTGAGPANTGEPPPPATSETIAEMPVVTVPEVSGRSSAGLLSGADIDPGAAADVSFSRTGGRILASPIAKRMAAARDIELGLIKGTGRNGRIRKRDVLAAADRAGSASAPVTPAPPATVAKPAPGAPAGIPRGYEDIPHEIVETSHLRRAISEHMIRSRQTAAHMTTETEVDMHKVSGVRSEINRQRSDLGMGRISFLSFIARAAISTLAEFPDLNATFQHEQTIHWKQVNLGVAVDTPGGLMVPVIRGAEKMTVESIAESVADIAERTRSRKLAPDDLVGGTFTLSNPGSVGAVSAPAIINQPQVAILGTPAIVKRPWVVTSADGEEAMAIRPIMKLALTFDHRAVDGADATRFVVAVKDRLESWDAAAYR